jgi:hypothetical protein
MTMAQIKQAAAMIRKVCQPKTGVATGKKNFRVYDCELEKI